MVPVEILPFQENIVLRAQGSELLIQSVHVRKLQDLKKPGDFSQYFRAEALVNRPARKLFEAWLRKDNTLWPRLYKAVQGITISDQTPEIAVTPDLVETPSDTLAVKPKVQNESQALKTTPKTTIKATETPLTKGKSKGAQAATMPTPQDTSPPPKASLPESLEKPQTKKLAKTEEKPKSSKKPSKAEPAVKTKAEPAVKTKKVEVKPKATAKDKDAGKVKKKG